MNKNKHYLVQLFLNIICFIIVFVGSIFSVNNNLLLNIVLGTIILICIIIQVIVILKYKDEK